MKIVQADEYLYIYRQWIYFAKKKESPQIGFFFPTSTLVFTYSMFTKK